MSATFTKGSTISAKGQFTLPKKLREKYNINKGTRLRFIPEKDYIKIVIPATADIDDFYGFIKVEGPQDFDAIRESVRLERVRENH